ncbi:allantoate amidohydrolase [Amnibacterium sp.]|uniref:allantoate amidohydrolase n=1 Tax=Amnibacterium sp. TaxID=1872496 RepID=UPI00261E0C28|nr:allantoate amidohydrolase [Amnibacterium sp.]MCU1472323.1 allantoate amidohydrolase [Amnibacterium sp.]
MTGAARALARCDELGRISARQDALERTHLSPEHAAADAVVAGWMREAGLTTHLDPAGNRIGRREGARPSLPALVLGSHLDTVPDAGRYDGMLGVVLAIEVADRLRHESLPFAIEVVGFTDEEGTRFGDALFGSRAFAGGLEPGRLDASDAEGVTVRAALEAFGLDPGRVGEAARRPEELVGYLEVHIEQGPELLDAGRPLAVVSSIAAARRFDLEVTGRAAHAGGAPYARRRDALVGAAEIVVAVERIAKATGTVATVGRIRAEPGGVNVVPGRALLSLDVRAERDEGRDEAVGRIDAAAREICAARHLGWHLEERYRADAVVCDPALTAAVAAGVAAATGQEPPRLFSRAGHDGMAVAAVTGIGMLFVRCGNDGVSHSPDETVDEGDVGLALDAFEAAVRRLAAERG